MRTAKILPLSFLAVLILLSSLIVANAQTGPGPGHQQTGRAAPMAETVGDGLQAAHRGLFGADTATDAGRPERSDPSRHHS